MQEKQNQKVVFVSLSPFTQILNMKNVKDIPKKIKSLSPITSLNPLANSITNSKGGISTSSTSLSISEDHPFPSFFATKFDICENNNKPSCSSSGAALAAA